MPFDAYKCYLSMKNHFTKDKYDYPTVVKVEQLFNLFIKEKDRFWFEKLARNKKIKK